MNACEKGFPGQESLVSPGKLQISVSVSSDAGMGGRRAFEISGPGWENWDSPGQHRVHPARLPPALPSCSLLRFLPPGA